MMIMIKMLKKNGHHYYNNIIIRTDDYGVAYYSPFF